MADSFKLDVDGDGIVLVTWDKPGRSMNLIDVPMMAELAAIVEKVASDAAIKGAVITSGKDTFSGGADLALLEGLGRTFAELAKSQGQEAAVGKLFEESRKLSQLYRRLETSGKPWVAAINGTALGGGFELCLACHQRIAAESDQNSRRIAGGQSRPVSRRRWYATRGAHAAARRCTSISTQGRPASPQPRQGDEAH